jgi:uncharacterized protein (TIGR00297 family)
MIGLIAAAMIALSAYRARALTTDGALGAFAVGAIVFDLIGWTGAGALLTFFVTSTALGHWRRGRKETLGFEKGNRRDIGQVLANGGAACVCLIVGHLLPAFEHSAQVAYFAAVAAANADTWATEIGAALQAPARLLSTFRPVAPGTSGAVSLPGTVAAVAGALVIGLWYPQDALRITVSGLAGCLVDSLVGATLQASWRDPEVAGGLRETPPASGVDPDRGLPSVTNDVVNWCCTASAAIVALLI